MRGHHRQQPLALSDAVRDRGGAEGLERQVVAEAAGVEAEVHAREHDVARAGSPSPTARARPSRRRITRSRRVRPIRIGWPVVPPVPWIRTMSAIGAHWFAPRMAPAACESAISCFSMNGSAARSSTRPDVAGRDARRRRASRPAAGSWRGCRRSARRAASRLQRRAARPAAIVSTASFQNRGSHGGNASGSRSAARGSHRRCADRRGQVPTPRAAPVRRANGGLFLQVHRLLRALAPAVTRTCATARAVPCNCTARFRALCTVRNHPHTGQPDAYTGREPGAARFPQRVLLAAAVAC